MVSTLSIVRRFPRVALALFVAAMIAVQALTAEALRRNDTPWVDIVPDQQSPFNPDLFRIAAVGNLPVVIDWLWITAMIDPSLTHVEPGKHPTLFYQIDLLTELDPAYFSAYTVGGTFLSVIRDDHVGARQVVMKGERFLHEQLPRYRELVGKSFWPYPWQVPALVAYLELFEFYDLPLASQYYKETAEMPEAPGYFAALNHTLSQKGGWFKVAIQLLDFQARVTKNDKLRDAYLHKLAAAKVVKFLYDLSEDFATFRQKTKSGSNDSTWKAYVNARLAGRPIDPWGGTLSMDSGGHARTTTPHGDALGLEKLL